MSIERDPWDGEMPPTAPRFYHVVMYPNQVGYRDPLIGFELKGALALLVKRVTTARHPHNDIPGRGEAWNVRVTMQLPDRDDKMRLVDIKCEGVNYPDPYHLNQGLTPEQSCVVQQLKWMWNHEFKEGIRVRGVGFVDSPEGEHD